MQPPRIASLIVRLTAGGWSRSAQLGDLHEDYAERAGSDEGAARRWYWGQALSSVRPNLAERIRRARMESQSRGRGDGMMSRLLQDLGFAVRSAKRNVVFSLVIALTLGVGIGANAAIFSVVWGAVLRPFPFPDGASLEEANTELDPEPHQCPAGGKRVRAFDFDGDLLTLMPEPARQLRLVWRRRR